MSNIKIALAGNPNVGKSTIFNLLTGLRQHTGNWTGKTVENAKGKYIYNNNLYEIYDLPGTYSLISHSKEEKVARDFILSNTPNLTIVVCDSLCLERNLNLVLQILEITKKVIVVVNLMDEAKKNNVKINLNKLSNILDVPVVGCSAKDNIGIDKLKRVIEEYSSSNKKSKYNIRKRKNIDKELDAEIIINECENISKKVVKYPDNYNYRSKLDKLLTNKKTGIPLMLLMLFIIFWITIVGSNYPSELLSKLLFGLEDKLYNILSFLPKVVDDILIHGIYKTTAWVVSVMLPPMMIFFPLFTLLEDYGILPRIAFNLDGLFQKCNSCGKQCLTMCMGIGCNAVGVTGCRIIDSKRERLIAILTNNFMPCNGRYPSIIAMISIFFIGNKYGILSSFMCALMLVLVILLSIIMTFIVSKYLSKTLLKGEKSSFILELPKYRKPKIGSVIVRSILDRTIFVLGRAITVAAPCGLIIWLMINIKINGLSLITIASNYLDTIGYLIGLDGVILLAFILGIPANEIILPIILMTYMSSGNLISYDSLESLKEILINNNWTILTSICFIILSIFHYPCATTLLTIKKETGSIYWTIISFILPTIIGISLCFIITTITRLIIIL